MMLIPPRSLAAPILIAALFFAAIAPTLPWQDFSSGSENLVVATVLEMHRDNHWIVPTLQGRPRIAKPPLAAWMGCASASQETINKLSSEDPPTRDAAYKSLAWQLRWPALAVACIGLIAVYALAQTLAGPRTGWIAALVAGSCVFFLRYARVTTTDVELFTWVAIANALLAAILFERRPMLWVALGAALGVAFMSKGPVALLQTVVPAIVFALISRRGRCDPPAVSDRKCACSTGPIVAAIALFLLIALPWFILAMASSPSAPQRWISEVLRDRSTGTSSDNPASYLILLPEFLPWTVFLLAGVVEAIARARRSATNTPQQDDRRRGLLFAAALLIVPILVMTFFRDRKDRYLLPMVAPAAVLSAFALRQFIDGQLTRRTARTLAIGHWILLALLGIGLPIAGALRLGGHGPWHSWWLGAGAPVISSLVILAAIALQRRPAIIVPATVAIMLMLAAVFMWGYVSSPAGRSDMKPIANAIRARAPAGEVYYVRPDGKDKMVPLDLSIYLNRTVKTETAEPPDAAVSVRVQRRVNGVLEPEPTLPGWEKLARVPRDDDFLCVFVRR